MAASDEQSLAVEAGEFVLGTLENRQAQRFAQRLGNDAQARRWLVYWERRLGALGMAPAPVAPPASVWTRVAARIGQSKSPAARRRKRGARAPRFWRGLAIAASLAAIVLAAMLFSSSRQLDNNRGPLLRPAYASVIHDQATGMSWLITAKKGSRDMSILAMGDYDVPRGKILRAWLKPKQGKPVLLGELPHHGGAYRIKVSKKAAKSMDQPAQLLVSREDKRYAGTPAPHGKVLWQAPLAHRAG